MLKIAQLVTSVKLVLWNLFLALRDSIKILPTSMSALLAIQSTPTKVTTARTPKSPQLQCLPMEVTPQPQLSSSHARLDTCVKLNLWFIQHLVLLVSGRH
jgi:hypothetical protein